MRPPISPTSCLAMVVPRPVPPKRRVVDSSACVKLSKIFACASGGMPMPVSRMENFSRTAGLGLGLHRDVHRDAAAPR